MIGDRLVWGQGYAREGIELTSQFAFETLKLHRLWAESPNPAFNRAVEGLGWINEGIRRDAFKMPDGYEDLTCWSLLRTDGDAKR